MNNTFTLKFTIESHVVLNLSHSWRVSGGAWNYLNFYYMVVKSFHFSKRGRFKRRCVVNMVDGWLRILLVSIIYSKYKNSCSYRSRMLNSCSWWIFFMDVLCLCVIKCTPRLGLLFLLIKCSLKRVLIDIVNIIACPAWDFIYVRFSKLRRLRFTVI